MPASSPSAAATAAPRMASLFMVFSLLVGRVPAARDGRRAAAQALGAYGQAGLPVFVRVRQRWSPRTAQCVGCRISAGDTVARMELGWTRAQGTATRAAWEQVLRPVAGELTRIARAMSVEGVEEIAELPPDLLPDAESFEGNRASAEASILGFAQLLDLGADPAAASLGAAT